MIPFVAGAAIVGAAVGGLIIAPIVAPAVLVAGMSII